MKREPSWEYRVILRQKYWAVGDCGAALGASKFAPGKFVERYQLRRFFMRFRRI